MKVLGSLEPLESLLVEPLEELLELKVCLVRLTPTPTPIAISPSKPTTEPITWNESGVSKEKNRQRTETYNPFGPLRAFSAFFYRRRHVVAYVVICLRRIVRVRRHSQKAEA